MRYFNRLTQSLSALFLIASGFITFSLIALALSTPANANTSQTVVYIDPVFYQHQERLLHPYYNYWFSQGPTVESVAMSALKKQAGKVQLCEAGQVAQQVIALSPTIFYNPQIRRYYSTIKATVYAGDGTLLGTFEGNGEQDGFQSVDVGLQGHMKAAYVAAMDDLLSVIKLSQDKQLNSDVKLPCQIIGAQTKPNYIR